MRFIKVAEMSCLAYFDEFWKKLVFFGGDIRRLHSCPWVTWSKHEHQVNYDEVLEVLPLIKYGDVGIHRDWGYFSNIAIPGFMKHGWIHINDGIESPKIVEAISEGVLGRNPIYPLFSDYVIILSPKEVSDEERRGACKKAKNVIGEQYDVNFKFDIEEELKFYTGIHKEDAKKDLGESQRHMKKFDHAFSCTELVSYSWWHKREDLRLYRKERRGKSVIIADDFLNSGWSIKWASKSVTLDMAKKYGLHEEGLSMIEEYLANK